MGNFIRFIILGLFLGTNIYQSFGQRTFAYTGVIRDITTNKSISKVNIYIDGDTAAISSSDTGEFSINVHLGSKVYFRKTGYIWENIKIAEDNPKTIKMRSSQPKGTGNRNGNYGEILVDGKFLPEEEWNDINPNEIKDIGVSIENGGVVRLTITTK